MPIPDEEDLNDPLLYYTEHNPTGRSTILLIHGACTTSQNWDLVPPFLANSYHLLIPDLPGHGQSLAHAPDFSIETASYHLSRLIRSKAHDGRVHIVGHSLGANITIHLIATHPELINAVFISGFAKYPRTRLTPLVAYGFWVENRIETVLPRALVRWLMDGMDLGAASPSPSLRLCRQVVEALMGVSWPTAWSVRTLVVVAGKSGILPTSDRAGDALKLGEIGREGNGGTVVVTHPLMRHPWNRQAPELFAQTARAWFEGDEIPSGFEPL
jgi:pimeloyl-ACP methyl ester carboxylesterase